MHLRQIDPERLTALRRAAGRQVSIVDEELEKFRNPQLTATMPREVLLRHTTRLRRDNQPMLEAFVLLACVRELLAVPLSDALIAQWCVSRNDRESLLALRRDCTHPFVLVEQHRPADESCPHCSPMATHGDTACALCGTRKPYSREDFGLLPRSEDDRRFVKDTNGSPLLHVAGGSPPEPPFNLTDWLRKCAEITDIDELVDALAGPLACERMAKLLTDGLPPPTSLEVQTP
jgi:hypothetical protein